MASEPALGTATTPLTVPPDMLPDYDSLVMENDTPVDNIYSEKQQRLLTEVLYCSWAGPGEGRPFLAASNVGVFYGTLVPPIVPDAFLSIDVRVVPELWRKQNRSYFVWLYGKAPEVVVEVVSNTDGEELGRKLEIYTRVGAPYYVVWDPFRLLGDERLHVFGLIAGSYQKQASAWFPNVNLGLKVWTGVYEGMPDDWLRWYDTAGAVVATGAEAKQLAQQHAEKLKQELVESRQREDKLAMVLRAHGLEPPQNGQ